MAMVACSINVEPRSFLDNCEVIPIRGIIDGTDDIGSRKLFVEFPTGRIGSSDQPDDNGYPYGKKVRLICHIIININGLNLIK